MKKLMLTMACTVLAVLMAAPLHAQGNRQKNYVTVQITPDRPDWTYKAGEKVVFSVSVIKDNYPQKDLRVSYTWGPDMLAPIETGTVDTGGGAGDITLKGMAKPGFMTLNASISVDGILYANHITVAFDPYAITPHAGMPADFRSFWHGVVEQARKVPLESEMTLDAAQCSSFADVYQVRFQNNERGRYVYGVLTVPKGDGPFPVVVQYPGAGVRGYRSWDYYARNGIVLLEIGIHGIPVDMPDRVYGDLANGALRGYNSFNADDRDRYYYKHVYTGCIRALDFVTGLPFVDGDRVGVCGGSQGGALTIVTAGLDARVKYAVANFPALADIGGYYRGGTGGWPHFYKDKNEPGVAQKVAVSEYYDVVNFAREVKVPIIVACGFNDKVCSPTSMLAAYNVITADKEILFARECGHWLFPETLNREQQWLVEQLKK